MIDVASAGIYSIACLGPGVIAAFSGREYSAATRDDFRKANGIPPGRLIMVKQVHGGRVLEVKPLQFPSKEEPADALVTRESNLAIGILTADCIPAFFHDPVNACVGVAHAGWRGLKAGILRGTIEVMIRLGSKPENIRVSLGPFIRPCCYEVGEEFAGYFPGAYLHPEGRSKGCMDLARAAEESLLSAGITPEHFFDSKICTSCRNDLFFSARKEKTSERILSLIMLRAV